MKKVKTILVDMERQTIQPETLISSSIRLTLLALKKRARLEECISD